MFSIPAVVNNGLQNGSRYGDTLRARLWVADLMQISAPLGPDQGGSPVFDTSGRPIGLALRPHERIDGAADRTRELGTGDFATRGDAFESLPPIGSGRPAAPRAAMPGSDELYERLSPAVLKVWVLPADAG